MENNKIVDGKIQSENIVYKKQFQGKETKYFSSLKNDAKVHFLFDFKTLGSLEVYEITKHPEIKILDKKTYTLPKPWIKSHLDIMTEMLSSCPYDEVGLMFGSTSKLIEDILCGESPVGKLNRNPMQDFLKITEKFRSLVVHNDKNILDVVFPTLNKDEEFKIKQVTFEENILEGLRILADENYKIGSNPQIEKRFPLSKEKRQDVEEIQKQYLGQLLNIEIRKEEKDPDPEVQKEKILNKMTQLREKLESQGIKLKIK